MTQQQPLRLAQPQVIAARRPDEGPLQLTAAPRLAVLALHGRSQSDEHAPELRNVERRGHAQPVRAAAVAPRGLHVQTDLGGGLLAWCACQMQPHHLLHIEHPDLPKPHAASLDVRNRGYPSRGRGEMLGRNSGPTGGSAREKN